jgi:hypothetical protein
MKLTQIKRKVAVTNSVWANTSGGQWTITTSTPHYLAVADTFRFIDDKTPIGYLATTLAGTTGSTIIIASSNPYLSIPNVIELENYGTGFTGDSDIFTFSFVDSINGLIHVVSNGTAGIAATGVKLQGSLDRIHWKDVGSPIATLGAGALGEIQINLPYVYGKLVFSGAISAADGGANTIKAYKAGA